MPFGIRIPDAFCQPAHHLKGCIRQLLGVYLLGAIDSPKHSQPPMPCLVEINLKLMGFWHFGKINAHLREPNETCANMYKTPRIKNHGVFTQHSKKSWSLWFVWGGYWLLWSFCGLIRIVLESFPNNRTFVLWPLRQYNFFGQTVQQWHPCHIFPVAVWHARMFDPNYPVYKRFLKRKVSCNSICQKALLWLNNLHGEGHHSSLWCI